MRSDSAKGVKRLNATGSPAWQMGGAPYEVALACVGAVELARDACDVLSADVAELIERLISAWDKEGEERLSAKAKFERLLVPCSAFNLILKV